VNALESSKIDLKQCMDHLDQKAPLESLEKFVQKTFLLKLDTEKLLETKLNGEVSLLKRDLENKLSPSTLDK